MTETLIVCIHGFMGARSQFSPLQALFAPDELDFYFIRLPGHEDSLSALCQSRATDWQSCVSAELDRLKAHHARIVLVTHSMGGLLAMRALAEDPTRAQALLCLALPLAIKLTWRGMALRLACLFPPAKDEGEELRRMRSLCAPLALHPGNSARLAGPTLGLLKTIRAARSSLQDFRTPCIAVHSDKDELVSERSLAYLKKAPAPITIHYLPKASHYLYATQDWQTIAKLLREFL